MVSFDFDFWVDPAHKDRFFQLADSIGFESGKDEKGKPPVIFYSEEEKIDVFFTKGMINREGERINFEDCYRRAEILRDPSGFIVRAPRIDDLITLKNCKKTLSAKDIEDIEYLKIIKERGIGD